MATASEQHPRRRAQPSGPSVHRISHRVGNHLGSCRKHLRDEECIAGRLAVELFRVDTYRLGKLSYRGGRERRQLHSARCFAGSKLPEDYAQPMTAVELVVAIGGEHERRNRVDPACDSLRDGSIRDDRGVIAGVHALIFADDAPEARAFFRDVLGFSFVDDGDGWLIFALPPAELGIHPGPGWSGQVGQHELFLMCHDIERTVDELKAKGVEFEAPISDEGFGLLTSLKVPGGAGTIGLYQPKHASPLDEFAGG
jgi:catechol 2,3-dioxygenase-like lactoylglutathione lyase family enzyme